MGPPVVHEPFADRLLSRALVESVQDCATFLLQQDGTIVSWNGRDAQLTGYGAEQALGHHFALLYPAAERACGHPGEVLAAAAREGSHQERGWCVRNDGSQVWTDVSVLALEEEVAAGSPGFAVVVRDLSAWRQAEAEQIESEQRFRTMADGAPVLLWMAGPDAHCTFFNAGWLAFTGRTLEQECGVGWAEGIHPEDLQRSLHAYLTAFVGRKSFSIEYRLRRADGEYRWIFDQGRSRYAPDGLFLGYIGSGVDITSLKEARESVCKLNDQLESRVRERTADLAKMVADREVLLQEVHHRVKNNLQLVSSLLGIQGRELTDPQSRASLEECTTRIQTIALVHDHLYQSANLSHVSFSSYARQLAQDLFCALRPPSSLVALELAVDDVGLSVDKAIPCGLIVNELITNALKHAFPGGRAGRVRLELHRLAGGRLSLTVADDGVGLPPGVQIGRSGSLGFRLLSILAAQLEAELEVQRCAGTAFRLAFSSGDPTGP
jgi:PAS domain S-box-containing protein